MAVKIDFNNEREGGELRRYRLRSDPRQYYLVSLIPDCIIDEDILTGDEIKIPKMENGEPVFKESTDKASFKTIRQVLNKYQEREGYDCNARTFEQLAETYEAAAKRRGEIEDEFSPKVIL